MKQIVVIAAILFLIVTTAHSFRCGGDFAKVGDSGFDIVLKCGEPVKKIPMGFTGETIKLIVEKWIYGPDGGYYYEVVLVGDTVTGITRVRNK